MSTAAQRLSRFAVDLRYEDLPPHVIAATRLHLLDTIGCGLAARGLGVGDEALEVMVEQGGRPESTAIGSERALPAPSAALANGMLCHFLDFDDTHTASGIHVSVTVIPAAIAAAQAAGAATRNLIAAVVAGYETAIRIGMAAPMEFHHRGFHPTSVCGIFGATVAASRLFGLGAEATTNAFGIAGSLASGLFEYLGDGSATKPLHPGWAAQAGIQAARLARRGTTGPATVLEGRFGLYSAFVGNRDPGLEAQLSDLGQRWETPNIAFKPYPACHFSHASLDAVRMLKSELQLQADDVVEVVATVPSDAVAFVLEPAESKIRPRSPYEAKFSLQFSIAAMLLEGAVGVATFSDDRISDPRLLDIAKRVHYQVQPYASYPAAFPGGARITTADGKVHIADLAHQRGSRGNPMTEADIREKFHANATLALGDDISRTLESDLLAFDTLPNVDRILCQLGLATVGTSKVASPAAR